MTFNHWLSRDGLAGKRVRLRGPVHPSFQGAVGTVAEVLPDGMIEVHFPLPLDCRTLAESPYELEEVD